MLRHAGGVRIDHIIGLFRLWWIPQGRRRPQGTYVRYDHEAMIGIVALEAHRAKARGGGRRSRHRRALGPRLSASRGLLGTSILWFELDRGGARRPVAGRDAGASTACRR